MSAKTIEFTAFVVAEVTEEVFWEVDADEFADWSSNQEPTERLLIEFLRSGRDSEDIVRRMWAEGDYVDSERPYLDQLTEIEVTER